MLSSLYNTAYIKSTFFGVSVAVNLLACGLKHKITKAGVDRRQIAGVAAPLRPVIIFDLYLPCKTTYP